MYTHFMHICIANDLLNTCLVLEFASWPPPKARGSPKHKLLHFYFACPLFIEAVTSLHRAAYPTKIIELCLVPVEFESHGVNETSHDHSCVQNRSLTISYIQYIDMHDSISICLNVFMV